tara:strand:- start:1362 stop:1997 length:636 start_codon:yes stop_codon:yes gene_type:complete
MCDQNPLLDHLIHVIPVLTDDEVNELNEYIDTYGSFQQSRVFPDHSKGSPKVVEGRTSTEWTLPPDPPITRKIHLKLNKAIDEYKRRLVDFHSSYDRYPLPGAHNTVSEHEGIQIIQYTKGQEYGIHHDTADSQKYEAFNRQLSVIVYLNDDFEGGATRFLYTSTEDMAMKPPKGSAIIFPSNWCFKHQGNPVESGKKRILVTWYHTTFID